MRDLLCVTKALTALCAVALLISFTPPVQAQITDRTQKKDWSYLFKLAQDVQEAENCAFADATQSEKDKLWKIYYRRVQEYVQENDDYIRKYTATRSSNESAEAFRYRVWQSTLKIGAAKARKAEPALCRVLGSFD